MQRLSGGNFHNKDGLSATLMEHEKGIPIRVLMGFASGIAEESSYMQSLTTLEKPLTCLQSYRK